MTLSLNEVDALAKKAARGAGYSWGLAEEAGKATRWLCGHSIDGCAVLAGLLGTRDGTDLRDWIPVPGDRWTAKTGSICPIITGAALSDQPAVWASADLQIENVAHPLLLAPFAGLSAEHLNTTVALNWGNTVVVTDGLKLCINGQSGAASASVTVTTGAAMTDALPVCTRAAPSVQSFETLTAFAHRTYAPATEDSRLKGAGTALSDND